MARRQFSEYEPRTPKHKTGCLYSPTAVGRIGDFRGNCHCTVWGRDNHMETAQKEPPIINAYNNDHKGEGGYFAAALP